jgi:predicted DCC family thiol-disulfide oxidoreductase YuxK
MTQQTTSPEDHPIVIYDGLCGLCDGVVQFLLQHDNRDAFRFAAKQSELAQRVLARHALDASTVETICLIDNCDSPSERFLIKSDATLRIAEVLGGIWKAAFLAKLFPRSWRDAAYDLVARNRYRIFGRRTECRLPSADHQHKFLG